MRVLAAVDKFRGTVNAAQVASAIGHACWELGHECIERPIADGGEGTLEALGGANRVTRVTDPLGRAVDAQWRMSNGTAIIEMARASGLQLVGGKTSNDPIAASTVGTGQLIDTALNEGAKRIIVCVGGSATTDGGLGAVQAISAPARLKSVDFVVACDVRTQFVDAARQFAPQKGASSAQVEFLANRLTRLVDDYQERFGVNVGAIEGAGAAGGLAGGLAALGARLQPGFNIVADELGLEELVENSDIVISGEGFVDDESFNGKVVGGMHGLAQDAHKPFGVICGNIDPDVAHRVTHVSLVERFGEADAFNATATCIERATSVLLTLLER